MGNYGLLCIGWGWESVAVMKLDLIIFSVPHAFQPKERERVWNQRFEKLRFQTPVHQLEEVRNAENEFEHIKSAYENAIESNVAAAHEIENAQREKALRSSFAKVVAAVKNAFTYIDRDYTACSSMHLGIENRDIVDRIKWETKKLLELKIHLYEHSKYVQAQDAMKTEIDNFITENLVEPRKGAPVPHDMLYLSGYGGAKTSEEIYTFNAGDPLIAVPLKSMEFLLSQGLIESTGETYKDNVTHSGRVILKRMNDVLGLPVAMLRVSDTELAPYQSPA